MGPREVTSYITVYRDVTQICVWISSLWILLWVIDLGRLVATVSKNFKINLEGQNYVHFYVILSRNVKIFGIMASL